MHSNDRIVDQQAGDRRQPRVHGRPHIVGGSKS
jgi:hypothetical protein